MKAEIHVSREEVLEIVRQKIAEKNPQFHIVGAGEVVEIYNHGEDAEFQGVKLQIHID